MLSLSFFIINLALSFESKVRRWSVSLSLSLTISIHYHWSQRLGGGRLGESKWPFSLSFPISLSQAILFMFIHTFTFSYNCMFTFYIII